MGVGWSVYHLHHRPLDLGLVGLVLFAPSLLLVVVTGAVVDHFDRKAIVIASMICEFAGSAALAALALAGVADVNVTLAILFVVGIGRAFGETATRTVLINVVDEDRFVPVSSLYGSLREMVVIGSPALGGALVAISSAVAFASSAALLVVAVAAFAVVQLRRTAAPEEPPSWRSAVEGLRFVRSEPVLLGAISLDLVAVLFGGATALFPIYASDIFHAGATGFGVLRSAVAAGALVMGLVLHRYPPVRRVGALLLASVAGFGAATLVFAFARSLWLAAGALALAGALDMISMQIRSGLVQLNTPDAMRGRVSAIEMVFIGASNELGAFESGLLAQAIGPVAAVAAGGAATLAVVGVWARLFPALARSDRLAREGP